MDVLRTMDTAATLTDQSQVRTHRLRSGADGDSKGGKEQQTDQRQGGSTLTKVRHGGDKRGGKEDQTDQRQGGVHRLWSGRAATTKVESGTKTGLFEVRRATNHEEISKDKPREKPTLHLRNWSADQLQKYEVGTSKEISLSTGTLLPLSTYTNNQHV